MILPCNFKQLFIGRLVILILMFFICDLSLYGQDVRSISRQKILEMDERDQAEYIRTNPSVVILDLITTDWEGRLAEDKLFLSATDFATFPLVKKLHILRNDQHYIIVPKPSDVPGSASGRFENRGMSESEHNVYLRNKNELQSR